MNTQAVEIALDHAVGGFDGQSQWRGMLFVILPSTVSPEEMEGVAVEAQHAGMRCFLVPMTEIGSKLLYMNLMVELMLVKRKAVDVDVATQAGRENVSGKPTSANPMTPGDPPAGSAGEATPADPGLSL